MNLLNKLTIKSLKLNRKRTMVTIIGIVLSVALITAVSSMYISGMNSLKNYYGKEQGNYHVVFHNVPASDLKTFEHNKAIETINIVQGLGYAKINSQNDYKPYAYVEAFSKNSLENLSINLIEGRLPQNENEIVIPSHSKTNGRLALKVGDTITLNVGKRIDKNNGTELNQNNPYHAEEEEEHSVDLATGEEEVTTYEASNEDIVDTTTKTYKIVGVIERPAQNIEIFTAPGYTFITYLNNISENLDLYVKFNKENVKNAYKLTSNIIGVDEKLYEKINSYGTTSVSAEELNKYSDEISNAKYNADFNNALVKLELDPLGFKSQSGIAAVCIIVLIIIVFTSVFCIRNSFDISITEKIKQYGMLRSIGATKKQIKKNVFYEAFILGIIGIPLGILLGLLASIILVKVSNGFLAGIYDDERNLRLQFSFSLIAILVSIILGVVTIYFSALKSAKKAAKITPIDSIKNSGNIKIKAKKLKSPKIIKKVFGLGGEISYKNLKRNNKKYRTTVISMIVSIMVFIALSSFVDIAFSVINKEINYTDYNIYLSSSGEISNELFLKYLETTKLDNIKECTIERIKTLETTDGKHYTEEYKKDREELLEDDDHPTYLTVISVGNDEYNKYIKSLGLKYDDVKDKGILMNYIISRAIIVNVKDNSKNKIITKEIEVFDFKEGDIIKAKDSKANKNVGIPICKITKEVPFAEKDKNNSAIIIVSDEFFEKLRNNLEMQSVIIYYDSSNPDKLQDDIEEILKGENYYLYNIAENAQKNKNFIILLSIFLYGFIIVISLIGITNIFNTITTNMELRKPEFAMLKSIGMTEKEFNKMIRLESIFMGTKSVLFGVPIGTIISYLIFKAYNNAESEELNYIFPWKAIVISVVVVFALIFIIMRYSIKKIEKQNTIETIRNENI